MEKREREIGENHENFRRFLAIFAYFAFSLLSSMFEMPDPGKYHRQLMLISRFNRFLIAH